MNKKTFANRSKRSDVAISQGKEAIRGTDHITRKRKRRRRRRTRRRRRRRRRRRSEEGKEAMIIRIRKQKQKKDSAIRHMKREEGRRGGNTQAEANGRRLNR